MSLPISQSVTAQLRRFAGVRADCTLTDHELVQRFAEFRDEAAFAALARRHGAMVLGVCRRVLGHEQDAEDVFQAVFLVLSRKAGSLRQKGAVGPWLFGVARRLALNARLAARRRRARESHPGERAASDPVADLVLREVQAVVDEELARLPERQRGPLVLCYLEGLTRNEAARQLGCPLGTLKTWLQQGRAALHKRLTRRGLALTPVVSTLLLTAKSVRAVPAGLHDATLKLAAAFAAGLPTAGLGSAAAVALAEGMLASWSAARLRVAVLLLAVALAAGAGAGVGAWLAVGQDRPWGGARAVSTAPGEPPPAPAPAADWPQWRGRDRDGVVHGVAVPARWPRALREEWQVPVGKGVASPVVVGDRVYLFVRQKNDDEVVLCLDQRSGKETWRSEPYPAPYKVGPGEGPADDRPRSTPAVADGRVFTLGMTGMLSCLDARTGRLLWRKDTKYSYYGGSSPLVTDGLCIAHVGDGARVGGLTAFDVHTGDVRWCYSHGGCATSGSPILADLAGERQVVTYADWNPVGVSLATGRKLWGAGPGGGGMPCTTGARYKDWIILADNMDSPRALRLDRGDRGLAATEVWKAKDLPLYYSSPVVLGDFVFGMSTRDGGCFFCLDAKTGKTLWKSEGRQGGYASLVSLGSVLLILKDRGELLVVKPSAAAFEPIAVYRVSDRGTLAHPVFLGDRILIKDDVTLRSFRIEPDDDKP